MTWEAQRRLPAHRTDHGDGATALLADRKEAAIIRLAPPEAKYWNANTGLIYEEPVELVDATIEALGMTADQRAKVERQRMRFGSRCGRASAA